jgi:hypothetical protein
LGIAALTPTYATLSLCGSDFSRDALVGSRAKSYRD